MSTSTLTTRLVLLAAISSLTSVSYAEMYKWVDAEGNTHYTQSPPPADISATTIKPPPKINPESARKQLDSRQQYLQEARDSRHKAAEDKAKKEQEEAKQKADCEKARARLASYQRPRVNLLDKNGQPSRASEEQRQAEIAKSQELIKKLCK